jgi:hypothetical protein
VMLWLFARAAPIWLDADFARVLKTVVTYRRFQNCKDLPGLKVGHGKIFNFLPNTYKLLNSISRDSGDSLDSNYTKYINYKYLGLKEIGVIFPSLRDA